MIRSPKDSESVRSIWHRYDSSPNCVVVGRRPVRNMPQNRRILFPSGSRYASQTRMDRFAVQRVPQRLNSEQILEFAPIRSPPLAWVRAHCPAPRLWFSQTSISLINWGLSFLLRFPFGHLLSALLAALFASFRSR